MSSDTPTQPGAAKTNERFFVDQRCGCIAVRDRLLTDPEYQGLHHDTMGVVWFEMGIYTGHAWSVSPEQRERAERVAAQEARLAAIPTTPEKGEKTSAISSRKNFYERSDGLYVCDGDHERSEPCRWRRATAYDAAAYAARGRIGDSHVRLSSPPIPDTSGVVSPIPDAVHASDTPTNTAPAAEGAQVCSVQRATAGLSPASAASEPWQLTEADAEVMRKVEDPSNPTGKPRRKSRPLPSRTPHGCPKCGAVGLMWTEFGPTVRRSGCHACGWARPAAEGALPPGARIRQTLAHMAMVMRSARANDAKIAALEAENAALKAEAAKGREPYWWDASTLIGPFSPGKLGDNDGIVRDGNGLEVADCRGHEARACVIAELLNRAYVSASPNGDAGGDRTNIANDTE